MYVVTRTYSAFLSGREANVKALCAYLNGHFSPLQCRCHCQIAEGLSGNATCANIFVKVLVCAYYHAVRGVIAVYFMSIFIVASWGAKLGDRGHIMHDPTINMHTVTRVLPCSQQLSSVHDFELNHEHIAHMHCLTTFPSRSTIEAHHLPMSAILYLPQSEPLHMSTLL